MYNGTNIHTYTRDYSDRTRRQPQPPGILLSRTKDKLASIFRAEYLLICLAAFLLSRTLLLEELLPFGIAYAAAVGGCRRNLLWPVIGLLLLGLFTTVQGVYFWQSAAVVVLIGIMFSTAAFAESRKMIILPAAVFFVTAAVKGTAAFLSTSTMYDLMLVGFEASLAAGFTYAFMIVFSSLSRVKAQKTGLGIEESICYLVLVAGVLGGLSGVDLGPFSLVGIVSGVVILSSGYVGGSGMGAGAGALVGIIPSITLAVAPTTVGLYSFSGLLAGLLRHMGKIGIVIGFITGHLVLALYLIDTETMMVAMGEMFLAVIVFALIPRNTFTALNQIVPGRDSAADGQNSEVVLSRVGELGNIFEELGKSFEQTAGGSEKTGESSGDSLELMLSTITANVCQGCSMFKTCWNDDVYRTYTEVLDLFSKIGHSGRVTEKSVGGVLSRRCRRIKEFTATVNCLWDICQVNSFWQKKLRESRGLVSSQLQGVAEIISGLVQQAEIREKREDDLEAAILEVLQCSGMDVKDINVFRRGGIIQCQVDKTRCSGNKDCLHRLPTLAESVLGIRMSASTAACGMNKRDAACSVILSPRRLYDIDIGIAKECKDGSAVSGDSFAETLVNDGTLALILSDGMGSGPRAARESAATVNLLKRLLQNGFNHDLAVKTVNAALALRSPEETFSTVDLAAIDLFSGRAEFVKIAAMPTFVKTANRVHVIVSNSLPIGILDTVDFDPVSCNLEAGDLIVMVTDGVAEADRRSERRESWLVRELEKIGGEDPQRIAEYLVSRAKKLSTGAADDMLVVAARIAPCGLN